MIVEQNKDGSLKYYYDPDTGAEMYCDDLGRYHRMYYPAITGIDGEVSWWLYGKPVLDCEWYIETYDWRSDGITTTI